MAKTGTTSLPRLLSSWPIPERQVRASKISPTGQLAVGLFNIWCETGDEPRCSSSFGVAPCVASGKRKMFSEQIAGSLALPVWVFAMRGLGLSLKHDQFSLQKVRLDARAIARPGV